MTQERPPSRSRNSTARTSAARSPQNERTVARLSTPGLSVATMKIAARVSGATTGCAWADKPAAAWGALIGLGSIGVITMACAEFGSSKFHARLSWRKFRAQAYHRLLTNVQFPPSHDARDSSR